MSYKNILVAVDFSQDSQRVIERAASLVDDTDAKVALIHVVEYMSPDYLSDTPMPQDLEMEETMIDQAQKQLTKIAEQVDISVSTFVPLGIPKHEIVATAADIDADLIVIGSHGRHGLQLLLGSTANGVLHLAKCDVLAVRIGLGD